MLLEAINKLLVRIWNYLEEHPEDIPYSSLGVTTLIDMGEHPHSIHIQRAAEKIVSYQNKRSGGWIGEVFATAFAIRAIYKAQIPNGEQVLKRAYGFLKNVRDHRNKNWGYELWDSILVSDAILDTRYEPFFPLVRDTLDWILSRQLPDGSWISPHLTGLTIMLIKKFERVAGKKYKLSKDTDEVLKKALNWLVEQSVKFEDKLWSARMWVNSYALKALISLQERIENKKLIEEIALSLMKNIDRVELIPIEYSLLLSIFYSLIKDKSLVKVHKFKKIRPAILKVNSKDEYINYEITYEGKTQEYEYLRDEIKIPINADFIKTNILKPFDNLVNPERLEKGFADEAKEIALFAFEYFGLSKIVEYLEKWNIDHLILNLDPSLITIPWEMLYSGHAFFGLRYYIGRTFPGSVHIKREKIDERLKILLVGDNFSLQYTEMEIKHLQKLLSKNNKIVVDYFLTADSEKAISKISFLTKLSEYDVIHYAGHVERDPTDPEKSFLTLGDEIIYAFEIKRFIKRPPILFFANACSSAKMNFLKNNHWDMAYILLQSGVQNYVGNMFPVRDDIGILFAKNFYKYLLREYTIGEALTLAKIDIYNKVKDKNFSWAGFILYGNPTTTIY